jgi:hypothetical protein
VTRSLHRRLATSDDSGSVLVIALAIVTLIALVIGGVLSYADSNMRATVALRTQSNAAATAEGAAQAALDTLDQNEFINQASSTTPDCFGATGQSVLTLPNLMPGATGGPANSAAVMCSVDESTGADGVTVPITSANKPGNAIFTTSSNSAENGLEVKALSDALPMNVHGGIVSKSNIAVTNGTLKSTVDVRAQTGCTGTINSTPAPVCTGATGSLPVPNYDPETTTVPALRTVPTTCPGGVATFEPGSYTDAQALSNFMDNSSSCKDSVWWFKPGVYYFDFQNTAGTHQWQVRTGQLLAGTPVNGAGTPLATPSKPISVPGSCDNPIHSETAVGVQWIFGGDSQFQVVGSADVEICGSYHPDRPMLAVYGVRTSEVATPVVTSDKTAGAVTTVSTPAFTVPSGDLKTAVSADGGTAAILNGAKNDTGKLRLADFTSAINIPAGNTLTSATLRIRYGSASAAAGTGTAPKATRKIIVTPSPASSPLTFTDSSLPSTTIAPGLQTVDLTAALAGTVNSKGLTGLTVDYESKFGDPGYEYIDSVFLDLTYSGPVLRAQSGCITQTFPDTSGCAVISTTTSYSGDFFIQGTTYTPLAPIDLNLSNITAQVLRFGVISRVLRVKETGAVSYDGPVIEIPDNSPGYGPGGTVVLLEVYVCEETSSCSPSTGRLRLRVRAYIKDEGAAGPTGGRDVVVQSWATQR